MDVSKNALISEVSVALPHGAVGWSAGVIVVFPNHTHLLSKIWDLITLILSNLALHCLPGERSGSVVKW